MIDIVIGLGFGDEGKGFVVDKLCADKPDAAVIRFAGGHQCGHNVDHGTYSHIFSNFGSGTLRGCKTIWWKDCTVDPVGFCKELNALDNIGKSPEILIHPACPVVTPFDKMETCHGSYVKNGTTGTGFGATVKRHEEGKYQIFAIDLLYPDILYRKLQGVKEYYGFGDWNDDAKITKITNDFLYYAKTTSLFVSTKAAIHTTLQTRNNLIFEGNQGVLLDRDHGFFPNVTRAKTISNAVKPILDLLHIGDKGIDIHLVSRCYATRHGKGFLAMENMCEKLNINNPNETNDDSGMQGKFRIAPVSLDMLSYAIRLDRSMREFTASEHLVFTCMDQVDTTKFPYIENWNCRNGDLRSTFRSFVKANNINRLHFNYSSVYKDSTFQTVT